jgi:hypothetical protein
MTKVGMQVIATVALGAIVLTGHLARGQAVSRSDWLSTGEEVTYEGYLLSNEAVYAACDNDCEDIDLYLYDAGSGDLVASDTRLSAVPVVLAPYDGTFFIQLIMVSCSLEPCETWTGSDLGF